MENLSGEILGLKQENKKILYLLFNPPPSARVRATIFEKAYQDKGYYIVFYKLYTPLINNILQYDYLRHIPFFERFLKLISKCILFFKTKFILNKAKHFNGIVFVKYTKSKLIEEFRKRSSAKLLYDFDDSVWLDGFLGQDEFKRIIETVDFVSCDNKYLEKKALKFNKNVFVVKGPTQVEKYVNQRLTANETDKVVIGWLGSSETLFYLYSIYNVLEYIGNHYDNVILKIIGNGNRTINFEKMKCEYISRYDEGKMIDEVQKLDIGIFPLFLNELSLGRGYLKATIYMSAGLPVVASNIGVLPDLIKDGYNGFLAGTEVEWQEKLINLIEDKQLRNIIGRTAKEEMINSFSISSCFVDIENNYLSRI
jgi:glycosyltransferase involved in cell wall biosynthesis